MPREANRLGTERERERVNNFRQIIYKLPVFVISVFVVLKTAAISRRQPKLVRARRVSLTLIFCAGFLFLGFINSASAATYYVRVDGGVTCVNKVNATSPNNANTSLSLSEANTCTFADGDQILYSSQGGLFAASLTISTGGSDSSHKITYANVPLETPIFSGAIKINTNSQSNIIISGFSVIYTGTNIYANGITITGASSDVTISNTTINMDGYGYGLVSASNVTNITISNVSVSNTGTGRQSIYFYGGANTNIIFTDVTVAGLASIDIRNVAGLTLTNLTKTGAEAGANDLTLTSCSGVLSIDNYKSTNAGLYGIYILTSAFTAGSIIKNSSITGATSEGYYLNGVTNLTIQGNKATSNGGSGFVIYGASSNITYISNTSTLNIGAGFKDGTNSGVVYNITHTSDTASNNVSDGFMTGGTSSAVHDVTYYKCLSSGNGTKTTTFDGDGFTSHGNDYNIFINDCISSGNTASGFAMVGNTSGHIYNSIAYNNAGNWSLEGGGKLDQDRGGLYIGTNGNNPTSGYSWKIKNFIGYNNYAVEVWLATANKNLVEYDYNVYLEKTVGNFATIDGLVTKVNWTQYHTSPNTYEVHSQNLNPFFVSSSDFSLLYNSPAIDAGTDVELTSDYTGTNPIYGVPDIGAYEYQPSHDLTIATPDTVDVGAGARIYADGKFRDLAVTTSVPAKLKIAPSGGSFAAYTGTTTRPSWLDVTAITSWTTAHKAWTESNAIADLTGTVHTVGDLDANRYYTVKKDDVAGQNITGDNCTAGVCLSNSSGQVVFTYTGTYSTHTFDMTELDSAKAITAFSFISPSAAGVIDGTNIAVRVPCGTDKTSLVPTVTITGSSVSPASGVAGNFSTPQTYTVTAEDGTTQTYTVSATSTNCGGGSSFMLLFTTTQPTPTPTYTPTPTPVPPPVPQNTMTPEQRASLIAQIKQQLISLITQLIQLLTLQLSQMK